MKAPDAKHKSKNNCQALVYYATGQPNDEGELNYYKYIDIHETQLLKQLQEIVGGNIESVPTREPTSLIAYVNENGWMEYFNHKKGIGRNELAGGTLFALGFIHSALMPFCYAGNVVVMGAGDKGLTDTQRKQLENEIQAYRDDA